MSGRQQKKRGKDSHSSLIRTYMEKAQFLALTSVSSLFSVQLRYKKNHLAEKAGNLLAVKSKGSSMGNLLHLQRYPLDLQRQR